MKGHQAQQHPHPHHELSELRLQILGGGVTFRTLPARGRGTHPDLAPAVRPT